MKRWASQRVKSVGTSWLAGCVASVVVLSAFAVQAQSVQIAARPLTPQEITDFGLTNVSQTAPGVQNVGLGQPCYLDLLVDAGTVVTSVVWNLDSFLAVYDPSDPTPPPTAAVVEPSPLTGAVPSFDPGDREDYDIAGRAMLVPDIAGKYTVSATVGLTNGPVVVTFDVVGARYIGSGIISGVTLCGACHADKINGISGNFNDTHHATAFTRKISGETGYFAERCISCHTVGYDTTTNAVNSGFDDVAADLNWTYPATLSPTNWTTMDPLLQNKANIQCENCHGPASAHQWSGALTEYVGVSLSSGNCGVCHDAMSHHYKVAEWENSGHGTGHYAHHYEGRSPCEDCHNGAGFVKAHDPDYAGGAKVLDATAREGISCATCHDPHSPDGGPHQIRELTSAPLGSSGIIVTEGGAGLLCMNCHQSRRDAKSYVEDYTGGTFRGPHHGPQAEMLAGANAYEFGIDMPSSKAHLFGIEDSCVTCHMQEFHDHGDPAFTQVGGHTWKMFYDGGTTNTTADDIHMVEACAECHGEIEDFNIGGEDWDRDGIVEGTQTEIGDLAHLVESMLPAGSPNPNWSTAQLGAYYNLHFVEEDGSHGVHNPKYAAALLWAAVGAMSGGIDVDNDGLVDTYEMAQFGNLTSQSGNSDADGDGVSNSQELALGTDPNDGDTDGDGVGDLAELQMGTNPMDAGSVGETNAIVMYPALELGFLTDNTGETNQFQTAEAMNPVGWTNIGPAFVSDGNAAFQLFTTRTNRQHFFRVVTP